MREKSTLFAADFHANRGAWPENNAENRTKDISGRKCLELYEKSGRDTSWPKMFVDLLNRVSTRLPHNWKTVASPSGRLLFQLAPSGRRTEETDCGSWPEPQANCSTGAGTQGPLNDINIQTPTDMWPTPAARDWKSGHASQATLERNSRPLNEIVTAWPTPTANRRSGLQSHGKNAILGTLNPAWVEALMGYPPGWTSPSGGPTEDGKMESPESQSACPTVSSD